MAFLNRLLIKWRIFGGFGFVIALSVVMAGYGLWALSGISGKVDQLTVLSANTVRVLEASHKLEAMRRAATRYASAPDPALVKEFEENAAGIDQRLRDAAKNALYPERAQVFNSVIAELARSGGKLANYRGKAEKELSHA